MRSSAGLNKGKKTVVTGEKTPFLAVSYLLVFDEQEKTGLRWPWESKQYIAGDEKWTRPELWWICYLLPAKDRIEVKQRPTIDLMKMLSCGPSCSFTASPWANDHYQVRRRMNSSIKKLNYIFIPLLLIHQSRFNYLSIVIVSRVSIGMG